VRPRRKWRRLPKQRSEIQESGINTILLMPDLMPDVLIPDYLVGTGLSPR
jgi:hypothetical protein